MNPILLIIILIVALVVNSKQTYDYKDIVSLGLAIGVIYFILVLIGVI